MCCSLLQLAPGSRDLSPAERENNSCKAEQIHKMTLLDEQSCHLK